MKEKEVQLIDSSSDNLSGWSNKDNADFYENIPLIVLNEDISRLV